MILLLAACAGTEPARDSGEERRWTAVPGEPIALTAPGSGALQTHATVAWGDDDRFAVAFAVGAEPGAQAVVQVFDAAGTAISEPARLNAQGATGDKPDIAWDGARYVAAWSDLQGRIGLAGVSRGGEVAVAGALVDAEARADAVDLAVAPGGGGVAIWTEFGGAGAGPTDGRIVWRRFDAGLAPSGPPTVAVDSSRKASDAEFAPAGGWVGVWAVEDGGAYEVWGQVHDVDGAVAPFRADDLDAAFPSRPAVAVRADGVFAVSWRDKREADGPGLGSGAYVRLFDAAGAPLGPSVAVGAGGDGDRVVVGWAGGLAVAVWQETDPAGRPGVVLSGVTDAGDVVIDRLWLSVAGGDRDERPSVAIREAAGGGWDALVVWEALGPGGAGLGLRARRVAITR